MKKFRIIFPIAFIVTVLDHASKWWIDTRMAIGDVMTIIPSYFDIVHWRNKGSAFGFLAGAHDGFRVPFFYITAAAALLFLLYYIASTPASRKGILSALGLIVGGALGNIIDRIWRGSVVDFLYFHWKESVWTPIIFGKSYYIPLGWPAFNVADSAITVGVTILLLASLKK